MKFETHKQLANLAIAANKIKRERNRLNTKPIKGIDSVRGNYGKQIAQIRGCDNNLAFY